MTLIQQVSENEPNKHKHLPIVSSCTVLGLGGDGDRETRTLFILLLLIKEAPPALVRGCTEVISVTSAWDRVVKIG
jgi:hypothetical protein